MRLDDRVLPAARYLAGDDAFDVLRVPVEASGGVLLSFRVVDVTYRPGSDVVVRYSARVSWSGEAARRETLVAATASGSGFAGAARVVARTHDGPLEVDVWRWPFDPVLVGLGDVVRPRDVADLIGIPTADLSLDVVAYHPTERAVVRASRHDAPIAYIKVVAPARTASIVRRHELLLDAGLPVARVSNHDADRGTIVMDALPGPTLRELVKSGAPGWPDATEFDQLAERLAAADIDAPGAASRVTDGALHARMLARVVPAVSDRLVDLAKRFERSGPAPHDGNVHGDLYDAQVIVDGGRIVGLLDIDDVGTGASVDDRANLIARLIYRSLDESSSTQIVDGGLRDRIADYARTLRCAGADRHGRDRLDLHVAACLVGLATGPFRLQSPGWREAVARLVAAAEDLTVVRDAGMREVSRAPHDALIAPSAP